MKAEVLDPDTGDYREIRLRGQREPVSVEYGIADELLAPKAKVRTDVREDINAAQRLRVKDDSGDIIFEGDTRSSGTRSADGSRAVEARHDAYAVFADSVSISVTSPTDQDVLQAALNAAEGGSAFTLSYGPTPVSLGDDYNVDDRSVKRIFEDMIDRAGRVYHTGVSNTITVADSGAGGLWKSISPGDDPAQVRKYDEGDVESVINAVTVNGTAAEKVSATAEDSSSISTYGRRTGRSPYNISYISSTVEAQDMADALLEPTPQSTATVQATDGVGDITVSHINETIDITDPNGTGADETLTVVGQTIQPQQTEFTLGAGGQTFATGRVNRSEKSKGDVTEAGSVYNSDRIADDAVEESKLVDLSVTEQKLSDLAVATNKLQSNAVINGKLSDLSVSETKIQDDSIATPKLQAEAVTASEIEADTITAAEIAAGTITAFEIEADTITAGEIDSRTITALEIAADSLTANEINALNLDVGQITVGDFEFSSSGGRTILEPANDGDGEIGTPTDRMNVINSINADFESLFAAQATFDADATDPIEVKDGSFGTEIVPENDETCTLGTTSQAFESVVSTNYITETPERLGGVDAAEITGYDWRYPPKYVAQRKAGGSANEAYRKHNPNDGVELAHMANYLFEVCKDQQSKIESLESTVDDLESRLADLEAKQE